MPKVLSITPLSRADSEQIRGVDPSIELTEAGGWFDGEIRETWPAFTVERYLGGDARGHGSAAERDALLADAEIVLGSWPFPLDLRARAPKLRWFHQRPAGASNLRRGDLWESDVVVTTSRGYADSRAIAEYVIAGLLHFAKSLDQAGQDAGRSRFNAAAYRPVGLASKTVCVLGAGGIGRAVARLCAALDMRVIGIRSREGRAEPRDAEWGFSKVAGPGSLIDWAPEIDFLVVACQWTPTTTHLVNAQLLGALKPGAVLVNIARGEIIDEIDLLAALDSGRLRGAVLDVYTGEFEGPPPEPLWSHPKVLLTPHVSAATDRPAHHSIDVFVANLRCYLDGRPMENVIDWERGY